MKRRRGFAGAMMESVFGFFAQDAENARYRERDTGPGTFGDLAERGTRFMRSRPGNRRQSNQYKRGMYDYYNGGADGRGAGWAD